MKKYQIIYADPPYSGTKGNPAIAPKSRIIDKDSHHYSSMNRDEILKIPLHLIADDDCLLFLWVRSPMLDDGIDTGQAWGFNYKTIAFVWEKQRTNPGSYTLSQCEICLLFKKGKIPLPRGRRNIHQFLSEMRREHSQKPDTIRNRITKMFPTQNKIELFARQKVEGWDCWGNEVESDIELPTNQ